MCMCVYPSTQSFEVPCKWQSLGSRAWTLWSLGLINQNQKGLSEVSTPGFNTKNLKRTKPMALALVKGLIKSSLSDMLCAISKVLSPSSSWPASLLSVLPLPWASLGSPLLHPDPTSLGCGGFSTQPPDSKHAQDASGKWVQIFCHWGRRAVQPCTCWVLNL